MINLRNDDEFESFEGTLKELLEALQKNAAAYAQASLHDERCLSRASTWNVRIDDYGDPEIYTEYNDSCNCHPEWQTESISVTWDLARQMLLGNDWLSPVQKINLERQERERIAAIQRAAAAAKAEAKRKETQERAEFERLQKKYGEK